MDSEEKRKQLERDILVLMENKLAVGQMSAERAQKIAKMLLEKLHPPLTLEQLYDVVTTLDDEFIELSNATIPLMKEHDDHLRTVVAAHAQKLIDSGRIEEAHAILKKANT